MNAARQLGFLFSILGLSLISLTTLADSHPRLSPFSAEYSLTRGYLKLAKVEVTLDLDDQGLYRYSTRTTPVGLTAVLHSAQISEISSGIITENSVIPQNYHYRHHNADNKRWVELSFDWQAMRVTNSLEGSSWSMKISPGTQDKFSQQLALMQSLAAGKRKADFLVADGGRTKDYSFRFHGTEIVDTAAGSYRTLKMARSKNRRPSQASLWLAPRLNHLPVIVEKREKDGLYRMELSRFAWSEPTIQDR